MTRTNTPVDNTDRERIRTSLRETLFVGAGAGTGKTTALVARVIHLFESGHLTDASQLVAITFTENAAAELRERIRAALARSDHPSCRGAVADLDDASITTVHGFAARLLADHPLEAGLPPGFSVAEGITAQLREREALEHLLDELLDDPHLADHLLAGLALGLKLPVLREVTLQLGQNWDQLADGTFSHRPLPPLGVDAITAPLRRAVVAGRGGPDGDSLMRYLGEVEILLGQLAAIDDRFARLELLAATTIRGAGAKPPGDAGAWQGAGLVKQDVIDELVAAETARLALVRGTGHAVTETLGARLAEHVLLSAARRREEGTLAFHDLLVLARDLLRDDDAVRREVHERLPVVMVDEFQDTDPLQAELVHLIAADPEPSVVRWDERPVAGGRLFFVGDPKQSIYRFRRADVELYRRIGDLHGAGTAELAVNVRSVPGVIDAVNHVFGALIGADPLQVPYAELVAARAVPERGPAPASVHLLGGPRDATAAAVRAEEASDVAAAISRVHAEAWPVTAEDGAVRSARFSDIAVLVPTRTSLSALEGALQDADVPYRIESRSLVWGTDAVRDVVTTLQAVDDPGDEVAVVAALRHPGLACSDVDLTDWAARGGRWNYLAPAPDDVDPSHPVAEGLRVLRELHDQRWWVPVHELVARLVRDLRLVELTAPLPRPRDAWRRLRFVVDQARAFEDAGGAGLGSFVAWALEQVDSDADVLETVVPEEDDDAVRILTVHGSKGLEFPVTVVTGMGGGLVGARNVLWHQGAPQLRFKAGSLETPGWADAQLAERGLDTAEAVRVLYVAMTRARDHLVLACHHKQTTSKTALKSRAQQLWESLSPRPDLAAPLSRGAGAGGGSHRKNDEVWPPVPDRDAWTAEREALLADVRSRVATSPTALVAAQDRPLPAEQDEPVRADEEAADAADPAPAPVVRRAGQQGRAIGTAVHWVLEHVDVAVPTRTEVDLLARAACRAAGLPGLAGDVAGRCWTALSDSQLQEAARQGRLLREVYVVAQVDGRFVEGYIDALVTDDGTAGGATVIDHKTDRVRTDADRDERRTHYAPQLEAYRRMLETAGVPVADARLLFASSRPEQRHR